MISVYSISKKKKKKKKKHQQQQPVNTNSARRIQSHRAFGISISFSQLAYGMRINKKWAQSFWFNNRCWAAAAFCRHSMVGVEHAHCLFRWQFHFLVQSSQCANLGFSLVHSFTRSIDWLLEHIDYIFHVNFCVKLITILRGRIPFFFLLFSSHLTFGRIEYQSWTSSRVLNVIKKKQLQLFSVDRIFFFIDNIFFCCAFFNALTTARLF